MAANFATTFSADIENYIQQKTLPLVQKQLVAYQLGDQLRLPKNRGTTYTASRYDRVPTPFAPLSEGVAPVGEQMTVVQVSAVAQQWGDTITVTDVADMTIKHPLFQKAIDLVSMQMGETLERNTFNNLMAGTQINYVNSRGARASVQSTDVLNPHEINRMVGALRTIGAPMFNGQMEEDSKITAGKDTVKPNAHYVAIMHTLTEQDMRENTTVVTAWSYSDIKKLYNEEIGEWGKVRFTVSNMVPTFTGVAQVNPTPSSAGALATGTYYAIVTGSDTLLNYESRIYQVSNGISVTGPNGSLTITTPATTGFTYSVYIGTTSSPTTLALSASGPQNGPLAGQAVQLPPGTAVTLTGIGASQTPPAAPTTGVTVYPTFIFGRNAYGIVMLDDAKFSYLKTADKSDPLNQLRVVGWKCMYGTIILNQNFFGRIESSSAFSATFG